VSTVDMDKGQKHTLPGYEERKGGQVRQTWMKDESTHKQETQRERVG